MNSRIAAANSLSFDVVVSVLGEKALVLKNGAGSNHWLLINTVGTVGNRDGIGAVVRVLSDSVGEQSAMVKTSGSYLSASDKRVHFGLGPDARVKLLEFVWPSGTVQRLANLAADQTLTVTEPHPVH